MRPSLRPPFLIVCAAFLYFNALALADIPVSLVVRNGLPEARPKAPVTWSVPFAPEDSVTDAGSLTLLLRGQPIPFQATPMARWGGAPGDSARPLMWLLLDFQLDLGAAEDVPLELRKQTRVETPGPLKISRNDAQVVTVETGAAAYTLSKTAFRFFDSVTLASGTVFSGDGGISYLGTPIAPAAEILVEHQGTERLSLKVRGAVSGDLRFTARIHFYRGLSEVKIDFRLENLLPYMSREGQPDCNDYGTPGSVAFDDLSLVFPAGKDKGFRYPGGELGAAPDVTGTYSSGFSLIQESSGDPYWNVLVSEAPRLQSGVKKRASTVTLDGTPADGPNQLGGWLDSGGVTVAVQDLWQNFPKALRARGGSIEAGLFPGEFSRNHELRAGEFKTHTVWVLHHDTTAADMGSRARSALSPLRLLPSAATVSRTRAADLMTPRMTDVFPNYENGVDYQITVSPQYLERPWESTAPTVLGTISEEQHYGWVDYGDIPTDFEPFNETGDLSSPFNLKYDTIRGMVQQAFRTGDETWWRLAAAGARHAGDIDMLHSKNRGRTVPRAWPDGGMYGHGYHDERGNTNPHRNYMNPSVSMSGPPSGMFLFAHITGDTLLLDSAIEAADSIWWKTAHSAYNGDSCASGLRHCNPEAGDCEGWENADGGRTGGNVIKTMLAAYLATGERDYLDLIPQLAAYLDCMEARDGLCCNRYHMQTIMMSALGHYALVRRWLGQGEDERARSVLARRLAYMKERLFSTQGNTFSMCYNCPNDPDIEDCDERIMCSFNDNWLFVVADAFATGSLVLGDPTWLTLYAKPLFDAGSRAPMGGDTTLAYHATKEFANQVGFGNTFLYAWQSSSPSACSLTCTAQASVSARKAAFSSTVTPANCQGTPVLAWSFGDGSGSSEQNPVHSYTSDGTYNWTFTASIDGQTCVKNGSVTASAPLPASELSLARGRIRATIEWKSQYSGQSGTGFALPQKDEFGYFYFSDANNPEVFVKCLDFGSGKAIILIGGVTDFYYKVTFKNSRNESLVFEKPAGSLAGYANNSDLSF